jgi:hypothetical protein
MRRYVAPLLLAAACTAPDEPRASLVEAPTIVGVAIQPAEVAPGAEVFATVVVATPDGPGDASGARWALCTSPRPVTDNNAVPAACLADGVAPVADRGMGVRVTLSPDACALFGPDPPPGGARPRDPDASGGYFQPIRVEVGDLVAFGMARILCPLGNAPVDVANQFADQYNPNAQPNTLDMGLDGETLWVTWLGHTAEPYTVYDPDTQTLERRLETLTVSWFATAGTFDVDRTVGGVTGASVHWTPPETPQPVTFWAVVRDDRGGLTPRWFTWSG